MLSDRHGEGQPSQTGEEANPRLIRNRDLLGDRGLGGAHQADRGAAVVGRVAQHEGRPRILEAWLADDHRGLDQLGFAERFDERPDAGGPLEAGRGRYEHEGLRVVRSADQVGELEEGRCGRRARRGPRAIGLLTRGHHQDDLVRLAGEGEDDVAKTRLQAGNLGLEILLGRGPGLDLAKAPGHEVGRGIRVVASGRSLRGDRQQLAGVDRCAVGVELGRRDRGLKRRRDALEREHHRHEGGHGGQPRDPVEPKVDHGVGGGGRCRG